MSGLTKMYLKVDQYRLYPNNEEKKKIDRELNFFKRLYAHLEKAVVKRFNIGINERNKIEPSLIRPLILGIIKRFKNDARYDFSSYWADDHFKYAADKIFLKYEKKKFNIDKSKDKNNITITYYDKVTVKLSALTLTMNKSKVSFINGFEAKIRPKNIYLRNYKTIFLSRICGKYYLNCLNYGYREKLKAEAKVCGIDIGLRTNFTVVDSNGNCSTYNLDRSKIDRYYNKILCYRKFIQNALAKNGNNEKTKNVIKLNTKITSLYLKIDHYRTYIYNRIAEDICRKYEYICIENFDFSHIYTNYENFRSIYNKYAFASFYRYLYMKAEKYNRIICKADRFFPSSRICSGCGLVHEEMNDMSNFKDKLECECGLIIDRDINAAKNLCEYCIRKYNIKLYEKPKPEHGFEQLSLFDFIPEENA